MNDDLRNLRGAAGRFLLVFLWCQLPLIGLTAFIANNDLLPLCIIAFVVATITTAAWVHARDVKGTRLVVGVSSMVMVSLVLAASDGRPWQPDIHMYYFAVLAMLAAYCDRDVILAGAGAITVHHLGLNYAEPALIFPGGTQTGRVILHAVIVSGETTALVMICNTLVTRFKSSAIHLSEALNASDRSRTLELQAIAFQQQQKQVVEALATALSRLSKGDLAVRVVAPFATDYEALRTDFNATSATLEEILQAITQATWAINSGSDEIAQASFDLSKRTEKQAAHLEETAVALNAVTATAVDMATSASEATQIASMTHEAAKDSGRMAEHMTEAIRIISDASNRIALIIGVIDDIASQTNMLSLNAEIEAACAGDAGRGFAIVANEVRVLAKRSAEAARDIKHVIGASTRHVETGVELAGETAHAFRNIIDKITRIDSLIAQISASSREQAVGLSQINVVIQDMDQAVQQNAAMAEQSTAAIEALRSQSLGLVSMMHRFKTKTGRHGSSWKDHAKQAKVTNEGLEPFVAYRGTAKI